MRKLSLKIFLLLAILISCTVEKAKKKLVEKKNLAFSTNMLDYNNTPKDKFDKKGLMFSDQGAWFGYSFFKDTLQNAIAYSGPFLMTQQNGIWLAQTASNLRILNENNTPILINKKNTSSYASHLEAQFFSKDLQIKQTLVFKNGHTALINTSIKNTSHKKLTYALKWSNSPVLADGISFKLQEKEIQVNSTKTKAIGYLKFPENTTLTLIDSLHYQAQNKLVLNPDETKEFTSSQTFIFPEYSWKVEKASIEKSQFKSVLSKRKQEKEKELTFLVNNVKKDFNEKKYKEVLAKAQLTLQNNWRIPAGEIKYEGLFPSYHYQWFNGFWSWDSWKHAVGLSYYNIKLAKEQVKLMFEFQNEDGFVADCVFRDTTIEAHNYRDTKPPLSVWAVFKIYEKDKDLEFVKEMYPKLKKYHQWWYHKRDHDKDGLCEYGSTDGSLIAAKWESGMDNAIRFDAAKILKNAEGAYSINQESVDLNAYLFAEKLYLNTLALAIGKTEDADAFKEQAEILKLKIQTQFYDKNDGWFYDTSLDGNTFIKGEGSEGWTALWANAATQNQAEKVKNNMMNPEKFYTKVPFQTMSANHKKFNPLKGYWRGPNWLDQAYFGVKALQNYGFTKEATKATKQIIKGANGVLGKGTAIRENYHPITGEGLNAKNFSWSAAHIIMLLQKN